MRLQIVLFTCMLFNLFGGAYSLETDLAFHTELIPVGPQTNAMVWDTIREEAGGPGYRFKDLTGPRIKDAPAWVDDVGDGRLTGSAASGIEGWSFKRFLDDGNMVVTYGAFTQHTAEELKQFAPNNEPLWAGGVQSELTPAGNRFTPSLYAV